MPPPDAPDAEHPPAAPLADGHDTHPHSPDPLDVEAALRTACARSGLDATGARLIHHYSNAIFYLPKADLVARVIQEADASQRLRRAQRVVRSLVQEHGFPATVPANTEAIQAAPDTTVTFWQYYPQRHAAPPLTSQHLGQLLKQLHTISKALCADLQRWVPLAALDAALTDPVTAQALAPEEREWLRNEVRRLRAELDHLDSPLGHGLIHGDAWAGNLLWDHTAEADNVILGDWDWVSYGPREVDLIPTWHAARRYGRGPDWTNAFVDRYGYDLTRWSGFTTLMRMRDLVQITGPLRRSTESPSHSHALRQRLDGIRTGDTTSTWLAF